MEILTKGQKRSPSQEKRVFLIGDNYGLKDIPCKL